jgi:hypothetical protein
MKHIDLTFKPHNYESTVQQRAKIKRYNFC